MKRPIKLRLSIICTLILLLLFPLTACGYSDEAYQEGYDAGYEAAYSKGFDEGVSSGYDEGYFEGYNEGQSDGKNSVSNTFSNSSSNTTFNSSAEDDQSYIVYITKTGEKYHLDGCSYLKSRIEITLEEAKALGYTPCSRCDPPS